MALVDIITSVTASV